MAINCWVVNQLTKIRCVGMCHGLAHTLTRLAYYLGLPDVLDSQAAGINHMCWLLTLTQEGRDIYPQLWDAMAKVQHDDPLRFAMMRSFGYFVTESPYHIAEYVPYFKSRFRKLDVADRDAPDRNFPMGGWCDAAIIEPTCGSGRQVEPVLPLAWDIQLYHGLHQQTWQKQLAQIEKHEAVAIKLSEEYAGRIIHSMLTNTRRKMSLNVINNGLIDNLTPGCTVEVPAWVDAQGLKPETIGMLPPQCGALCQRNVDVQSCVVAAIAQENKQAVLHALLLDPLTGACLEPDAIIALNNALIAAMQDKLPAWLQ
jgi:alpha-galactosidase